MMQVQVQMQAQMQEVVVMAPAVVAHHAVLRQYALGDFSLMSVPIRMRRSRPRDHSFR